MSAGARKRARVVAAVIIAGVAMLTVALLFNRQPREPLDAAPSPPATTSPPILSASASMEPPAPPTPSSPVPNALPPGCEDLSPPADRARPFNLKPSNRLRGADASSPAPWRTLREAGIAFAFTAATYGTSKNTAFTANWTMMKRCGLPRAAYHFLTHKSEGGVQARAFLEQLGDDRGELPPVIDVEKPSDCSGDCCALSCTAWSVIMRAWIAEVTSRGGRKPMVYTVEPFWNQCLCGATELSGHPLWLAGWPRFDFPERVHFGGWSRWTFYQYAGDVRVGGGVVDLNLFRGDEAEFSRWLREGEPAGG